MAKNDKYEKIFEAVLSIPIVEAFEHYGYHPKRCGMNYQLPSPLRTGSSSTSFTLNPNLNIYKDWVDNSGGNFIQFFSKWKGINYFNAGITIARDFGIIDEKTFKAITSKKVREIVINNYQAITVTSKVVNKIAKPEDLDKVFRIFINCCTLSEVHKKHLKDKRNLSDEEILLNMFFTFPTRAIVRKFVKAIEDEFGSQDILKNIPGFFKRKTEANFTFKPYKGIGIPIFNEIGQILGIQVRLDEAKGSRYFWFSSGNLKDDEEFGTSSGSPIDVVFPKELKYKGIFITEGKFKALKLANEFNCIALSVQGVSTWKPIVALLKRVCDTVNAKYPQFNGEWRVQMIYSAFDADMCENYGVYKQLKNMTDEIRKEVDTSIRGSKFNIKYLHWDVLIGKGIDDLINTSTSEELTERLQICDKDSFDEAYQVVIDEVIKGEKLESESQILSKLDGDTFLKYYKDYFKVGV